tara:strand:+ start:1293 stop:2030 length:738 start_codon:yes stop_codon:yes gene_type:complete
MRDKQRQKVYKWERSQPWHTYNSYLTEKEAKWCYEKLDYNLRKKGQRTQVIFSSGRGSSNASYRNGRPRILLKREWALNYNVILHEFAHILTGDGHGPNFVSVYCCLLHVYHPDAPTFKELARTLNEQNVDFKSFDYWYKKLKLSKRIKPFPDCKRDPLPAPVKKIRMTVKRKLAKLCEEIEWLYLEEEDYFDSKVFRVHDLRESENSDLYFDEMIDNCFDRKSAYEYALELVERDKKYGRTIEC